jgi:hypothetical protein
VACQPSEVAAVPRHPPAVDAQQLAGRVGV